MYGQKMVATNTVRGPTVKTTEGPRRHRDLVLRQDAVDLVHVHAGLQSLHRSVDCPLRQLLLANAYARYRVRRRAQWGKREENGHCWNDDPLHVGKSISIGTAKAMPRATR